jgi:hydroxymethylpyrimidine pyrophosphatase-like HAD family hydrolase
MTFCFDIDNTLLMTNYENGTYTVKHVNAYIVRLIKELKKKGHIIILHTGRHWNHIKLTKEQVEETGITYDSLVMGKPVADVYIDDRSVRPEECFKHFKNILED